MFEFSLASLLLIGVVFAVAWHFYATKILGYVAPAEAALRADWQKLEAKLLGAHDTLKADLTGMHDVLKAEVSGQHDVLKAEVSGQHAVNSQRIDTLEQVVTPAAAADVTQAAVTPAKPAP